MPTQTQTTTCIPPSPELLRHGWLRMAEALEADVREARDCDALDPCADCQAAASLARACRRLARS